MERVQEARGSLQRHEKEERRVCDLDRGDSAGNLGQSLLSLRSWKLRSS